MGLNVFIKSFGSSEFLVTRRLTPCSFLTVIVVFVNRAKFERSVWEAIWNNTWIFVLYCEQEHGCCVGGENFV